MALLSDLIVVRCKLASELPAFIMRISWNSDYFLEGLLYGSFVLSQGTSIDA